MSDLDDVATELRRIVDRLNSAPLTKVEPLIPRCHELAVFLVDRTRALGAAIPLDAEVPLVGSSATGAQLAVLGRDYLEAARTTGQSETADVLERLAALRRELP